MRNMLFPSRRGLLVGIRDWAAASMSSAALSPLKSLNPPANLRLHDRHQVDLALDLGVDRVRLCSSSIMLDEPAAIGIHRDTGRLRPAGPYGISVGEHAVFNSGCSVSRTKAVFPLRPGGERTANAAASTLDEWRERKALIKNMLSAFIRSAWCGERRWAWRRPSLAVLDRPELPQEQQQFLVDCLVEAGPLGIRIASRYEAMAALAASPTPQVIVDIGAASTHVVIATARRVMATESLGIGGITLDAGIARCVRESCQAQILSHSLGSLRNQLIGLEDDEADRSIRISVFDCAGGPHRIDFPTGSARHVALAWSGQIVAAITRTITSAGHQGADGADVLLCGGGRKLGGLAALISREVRRAVSTHHDGNCAIHGLRHMVWQPPAVSARTINSGPCAH